MNKSKPGKLSKIGRKSGIELTEADLGRALGGANSTPPIKVILKF